MSGPPGKPGAEPSWSSSRKCGVGTAIGCESPVWFTLASGGLSEIYFPTIDCANTRDVQFLVSARDGFFSAERTDASHRVEPLEQGVPAYRITSRCNEGRYRLTKTIFTDPERPAVVMQVRFEPLEGYLHEYRVFVLVAPHVSNGGAGNDGWVGEFKGTPLLLAQREQVCLAVGCSHGFVARSCGYVGSSDGYQQVKAQGFLGCEHTRAEAGNVALCGEIDLSRDNGGSVVVLGFGNQANEASHIARAALLTDVNETRRAYLQGWRLFQRQCLPLSGPNRDAFDLYRASTAVLRTHESKRFRGGIIASLSIPWGNARGEREVGGYHLVWPRDQAHAAMGLFAAGCVEDARRALFYLMCTQQPNGNWPQNMWVDGTPRLTHNQSDQTASFVLLACALWRRGELGSLQPWDSVRRAAEHLVRRGPATEQDRWEENAGYTPYTLATTIAALLGAAAMASQRGEGELRERWQLTADDWHEALDGWLYVRETPLSREVGVDGYYVRVVPPDGNEAPAHRRVTLRNYSPPERGTFEAWQIVSPDALAFVRYGLRAPWDPRILNTLRVIDHVLRRVTKAGPVWRRFTHDAYGESDDGSPFNGTGVGRGWPVLTGERALYELAAGNRAAAEELAWAMVAQSHHDGGLLPEQIWDAASIPERNLENGGPAGSAMPLCWAHAELVTLLRSLHDGAVFDCPPETAARYLPQTERPAEIVAQPQGSWAHH